MLLQHPAAEAVINHTATSNPSSLQCNKLPRQKQYCSRLFTHQPTRAVSSWPFSSRARTINCTRGISRRTISPSVPPTTTHQRITGARGEAARARQRRRSEAEPVRKAGHTRRRRPRANRQQQGHNIWLSTSPPTRLRRPPDHTSNHHRRPNSVHRWSPQQCPSGQWVGTLAPVHHGNTGDAQRPPPYHSPTAWAQLTFAFNYHNSESEGAPTKTGCTAMQTRRTGTSAIRSACRRNRT